MNNINN